MRAVCEEEMWAREVDVPFHGVGVIVTRDVVIIALLISTAKGLRSLSFSGFADFSTDMRNTNRRFDLWQIQKLRLSGRHAELNTR
jgi:hypothetical protein